MNGKLVLLVEDSATDVDLLLRRFRHWGVTNPVRVLETGQAARDYLAGVGNYADRAAHPLPIVLLLDLYLPGLSGLGLLEWIRTASPHAQLPVVVLSGTQNQADFTRAYALGANACLLKSLELADLRDLIGELDYFSLANPLRAGDLNFFLEAQDS